MACPRIFPVAPTTELYSQSAPNAPSSFPRKYPAPGKHSRKVEVRLDLQNARPSSSSDMRINQVFVATARDALRY